MKERIAERIMEIERQIQAQHEAYKRLSQQREQLGQSILGLRAASDELKRLLDEGESAPADEPPDLEQPEQE